MGNNIEEQYKNLIRVINRASVSYSVQRALVTYVQGIRNKERNNDFFEYEFLERVVLGLLQENYGDETDFSNTFDRLLDTVHFLLPQGMETKDYSAIKEIIINNFVAYDFREISEGVLDKKLYALFNNRLDYIQIVRLILSSETLKEHYQDIVSYASEVSPYCINPSVLKNELISFMDGLEKELGPITDYHDKRLIEVKKRVGVYPIGEKTLANISAEAEKAQGLIEKLEAMDQNIDTFQERINTLTTEGKKIIEGSVELGKKTIGNYADEAVRSMNQKVDEARKEMIEKLDQYLLSLQASFKSSSDQVFNKLLEEASSKMRDLRLAASTLQSTTTSELIRLQDAANSSLDTLKDYLSNDEKLKKLLGSIDQEKQIKEMMSQIATLQKQTVVVSNTPQEEASKETGVYVSGNSRLIVPMGPNVTLPSEGSHKGILTAFDESISFDKRFAQVMALKKKRSEQGELFHELTDEVIRCVMEGDWVYLWGPSGCGKTHLMRQVASLLGLDYIDNGKITGNYSIIGYNDPQGRYRATPTFVATTYGKLLGYDELDNGDADSIVSLNGIYSSSLEVIQNPKKKVFVTFGEDMIVPMSPNFRMMAAGNTNGEGENEEFSSRGKLDESVLERMTPIEFKYDNGVEERLFGEHTNWYHLFANFRKACDSWARRQGKNSVSGIASTRDAEAIARYIEHNSKTVDEVLRQKFIQTKGPDYLNYLARQFREYYDISGSVNIEQTSTPLSRVTEKQLAKRFVYYCEKGQDNR